MFETAEIGSEIDKATYAQQAPEVRARLLAAQTQLGANANFSTIILIGGVEGAGKTETVNVLLEWMDARGIRTLTYGAPSEDEASRPEYWRYWRSLPPKGRMAIIFGSWYTSPIVERAFDREDQARFDQRLDRIIDFERMLSNENVLLVKFWMHIAKKEQKKRLKQLSRDPLQSWRVSKRDWKFFDRYDEFRKVSEHALRRTSTGEAPWQIVEATDERYRTLTVTKTLLGALEDRLAASKVKAEKPKASFPKPRPNNVLRQLDMKSSLDKKEYGKKVLKHQGKIARLTRHLAEKGRSMVLVFEGPDAAGKGGAIRRVTGSMDARAYEVNSVAAPTDEERARPYLWRFWRNIPRIGRVCIFDRSWYGRVLVERIEGFCAPQDWQRAFAEINSFEEQLVESGVVLRKFWIHITAEEQLKRFQDRQETPYKQYKITEEDWRNRAKWEAYEAAAVDMFEKTSTEEAPWVLIEGNDKNWARVKLLKTVAAALEGVVEE